MHVYLADSSLPEMAGLSPKQRQLVKSECLYSLHRGWCYQLTYFAITPISIFVGLYLGAMLNLGFWGTVAIALLICLAFSYLHDLFWLAHFRPFVAQFIHDHEAEIQSAA
jgi:hypothetical protein